MNINVVALTGNLTRDPELRQIPSGTAVGELSVAVNERVKDSSGEWSDRASFFYVTVWGNQAKNCAEYLHKGDPVAIQGRLRQERWEKDGQNRQQVKIIADSVQFLSTGKKRDDDGGGGGGGESYREPEPAASSTNAGDDDIPFARPRIPSGERVTWPTRWRGRGQTTVL